jgi:DNA-binding response OmpR family regulator
MGLKVLVIEDQRDLAESIWDFLERRGHVVDHASDGVQGLRMARQGEFDVIVLDLGLPRLDGLEVCERLRAEGRAVPVLMLTARDTLDDRLKGFGRGADDYLVKPFAMLELEARVRNLHRRHRGSEWLACADLALDARSGQATRAGQPLALSALQSRLLEVLLRASPAVVDSARLAQRVWGEEAPGSDALHSLVRALRAVVDRPFERPLIRTVHGIGYRMDAGSGAN